MALDVVDQTATPGSDGAPNPSPIRRLLQPLLRWEGGLALVLVISVVGGSLLSPEFLTASNIFNLQLSIGEIAIMALPLTLIIIAGEIDLSVASTLGLSSSILGYLWLHHWNMGLIIIVVLAIGALLGLFNGLLVTRLGLPSLAVTIGTLTLYSGIALIVLGSTIVSNFPLSYTNIGVNSVPGVDLSYSMLIFFILAILAAVLAHYTSFGRSIYAIGSSPEAAAYSGIRVKRVKTILFVLSGVVCALAGILFTFRLSTAEYNNGSGLELNAVSIALLAGVSIFGGRGTIVGVVLSVATLGVIQNALLLTSFPQQAMGVVIGGLLLVSVFVPNISLLRSYLRSRHLRSNAASVDSAGSTGSR
ncbi:MAG: ABC transporter permease [Acidimicrobiales bacterium]